MKSPSLLKDFFFGLITNWDKKVSKKLDLPNNIKIKPILSLKNLISQIKKICKQKKLNKPNLAIIGYNDYPNRTANMQALRSRIAYKYSNLFNNIYLLFPNELFYKNNVLSCKEGKIIPGGILKYAVHKSSNL